MNRLIAPLGALLLLFALVVPSMAAEPTERDLADTGRTLIALGGDVTLPAGEAADAVIVADGTATIAGTARTVVALGGTVVTDGAVIESIFVIGGEARLGAGTTILDNVRTLDAEVSRAEGVAVGGRIAGLEAHLVGIAWFVGVAAILLWIGFGIATALAALLLAGLAARQVRAAGALIGQEPLKVFLVGLLAVVLPPVAAVALFVSVVGIPAGVGLLLVLWPAFAFVGYLVAAIWAGELIVTRYRPAPPAARPYLAAVVGVVVVGLLGLVPVVTAIVSLFGLGAVVLAAWRTFRGGRATSQPMLQPQAAPLAG